MPAEFFSLRALLFSRPDFFFRRFEDLEDPDGLGMMPALRG